MLGHGQQLDVGEAHLPHVGDELAGELPVRQPPAPGSQMHLVD